MNKILTIILSLLITLNLFPQVFSDEFTGIDSIRINFGGDATIRDFYNDGDSVLYIMGAFSYVNGIPINKVFSWNGDTIKGYDNGNNINSGSQCIVKYMDTLYVGGGFVDIWDHSKDYLTLWNGSSWQGANAGQPNDYIWDMIEFENKLWVCGGFGRLGGIACDRIGVYNGTEWQNVGSFGMWAHSLAVFNGELYAGGYWGVRKYLGGTEWETFPVRPNGYVHELEVDTFNTFMYVGGQFTHIGTELSYGLAMWDGFKWHAMGDYNGATVWPKSIAIYQGDVYIGGGLSEYRGTNTFYITRWDGERWDSIGGGFNSSILALELFRDEIYIGGSFSMYEGQRSKGMRKLTVPDNGCNYIKPRINTFSDVFYMEGGEAEVSFFSNNPYVDSWHWDFGDGTISSEKDPVHRYTIAGEYDVIVTVTHNECVRSWTKHITVNGESGVEEYFNSDIAIFPNPSHSDFTLKLVLTDYSNTELHIHGLNGHLKAIVPVSSEETLIKTDYWPAGVYNCSLFVDGKLIKTVKMVKN